MLDDHDREPIGLVESLERLRARLGTASPSALSVLSDAWPQLLGRPLESMCSLAAIRSGVLVVNTTEPAVAEQLGWMSGELAAAANELLGRTEISSVEVRVVRP
ncbi:MAG: DUF721 domain-containing protein [Microthrixaceae bacterium]